VSPKFQFLGRKVDNIINENDFKIAQKLPRHSRSTNLMFLFQSRYQVGCPVSVTSISGVKQQAYIVQGIFVSWDEGFFKGRHRCVCAYVQDLINNFIQFTS
jgi:hypothetical protein